MEPFCDQSCYLLEVQYGFLMFYLAVQLINLWFHSVVTSLEHMDGEKL